jgi:hypothetical protein
LSRVLPPTKKRAMNKEQMQHLADLEQRVQELRGYL